MNVRLVSKTLTSFTVLLLIGVGIITGSLSESVLAQAPSADMGVNKVASSTSELKRHHYGQDILGLRLGMTPAEVIKLLNTLKDTNQRAYANNRTPFLSVAGQRYEIGKPYAFRVYVHSRSSAYREMGFRQSIFVYFARVPHQNRAEGILREVEYLRPSITVDAFRQGLIKKYGTPDLSKGKYMLWGNKSCIEATYDWRVGFNYTNIWNHFTVGSGDAKSSIGCDIRLGYKMMKEVDGFVKKYTIDLVDARRAVNNIESSIKFAVDQKELILQQQMKLSATPVL